MQAPTLPLALCGLNLEFALALAAMPESKPIEILLIEDNAGDARLAREALRDAMAEEMRADPRVFVMGEEVAEYQAPIRSLRVSLRNLVPKGSSTHRSPNMVLPALAPVRRWLGCGQSSNS